MPGLAGWEGARGSAGFELSWEPFVMGTPIKTVEDPQKLLFVWTTSRARIRECSMSIQLEGSPQISVIKMSILK